MAITNKKKIGATMSIASEFSKAGIYLLDFGGSQVNEWLSIPEDKVISTSLLSLEDMKIGFPSLERIKKPLSSGAQRTLFVVGRISATGLKLWFARFNSNSTGSWDESTIFVPRSR